MVLVHVISFQRVFANLSHLSFVIIPYINHELSVVEKFAHIDNSYALDEIQEAAMIGLNHLSKRYQWNQVSDKVCLQIVHCDQWQRSFRLCGILGVKLSYKAHQEVDQENNLKKGLELVIDFDLLVTQHLILFQIRLRSLQVFVSPRDSKESVNN